MPYEGFGAPPLKAMTYGCPVACSDAASLPEVCGDAALRFDPWAIESIADAVACVTGEAQLRQRLRQAGLGVHNRSQGTARPNATGQYMPA